MQYQWYPGHMNKAKKQMTSDLKLVDVVVELVDARIPYSSKNPDIERMAGSKPRVLLLNKGDMADGDKTKLWREHYEKKGYFTVIINAKSGSDIKMVNNVIKKACAKRIEHDKSRGILSRPIRAMVVGIPNVGKSTFINTFAGKASARTGNRPGVTKGGQWIRVSKDVELLDTPGILWPKFEDEAVGMRLAFIGSISDNIGNQTELAFELGKYLHDKYEGALGRRYDMDETDDVVENVQKIAARRGCVAKGGVADIDRAASFMLDDFRNARIGNITLEEAPTGV